jgi:hypothetical protein
METKSAEKSAVFFECKNCDYKTSHRSHWLKHIKTKKHIGNIGNILETKKVPFHICSTCGKRYKSRSGLYKHKIICEERKELKEFREGHRGTINDGEDKTFITACVNTMMVMIKNINDKDKLFEKQQQQISDMIPKIGNNNNNKININVFLNEKCKDAINMSDFLEGIKLKLEDLDYVKDNNLQDSISRVFINQLKQLDMCKRPIHCTDIKRETLYIKENNDWSKEKPREKLKKSFCNVASQYRKKINDWEESNPGWNNDEKLRDEYLSLVQKTHKYKYGKSENKLIKEIAKETLLDTTEN